MKTPPSAPVVPDDAAKPAETTITTAMALDFMQRYLGPVSDYSKLELTAELDQVIRLLDPSADETWQWDIDEKALAAGIKEMLTGTPTKGFENPVEVSVDLWDCDLGDGDSTHGYLIEIKAELKQV